MTLTLDNVEAKLREAANNLPGDDKPDSKTWGQSFAHEALVQAPPELRAKIGEVFDRFLTRGTPEQATLAALTYPEKAGALAGIAAGVTRTDLPPEALDELVGALGRAIQAGQLPYRPEYRALIGKGLRRPLLFGVVVYDHAWFLDHVREVLGTKTADAAMGIWMAVTLMRKTEVDAVRAALGARRDALGATYVASLISTIDEGASDGRFETRLEPSRISLQP